MEEERFENKDDNSNNYIKRENEFICMYCKNPIAPDIFEDHILCHKMTEGEKSEINNIDNKQINNNSSEKNTPEEPNNSFGSKFFGFFENIGNKAKDLFMKENKEDNKDETEFKEDQPNKISIFFDNIAGKISQTFNDIKKEISDKFNKKDSEEEENTPISFTNSRYNEDLFNDNINNILTRLEQEDDSLNNKKENLFKESDANEILRYIPNTIIKEEKNKNDNNYKCMICLYEYKLGEKVCTLPCLHIFHIDCLKNWIIRNRSCPICKYDCSLESLLSNNIPDNI